VPEAFCSSLGPKTGEKLKPNSLIHCDAEQDGKSRLRPRKPFGVLIALAAEVGHALAPDEGNSPPMHFILCGGLNRWETPAIHRSFKLRYSDQVCHSPERSHRP
jgi:hypothetical protein